MFCKRMLECAMMRRMRKYLYRCAYICGLISLVRFLHRNSLTVILYHGVAPTEVRDDIYNYRKKFIAPEHFEKQLAFLKAHYTILPLEEALQLQQENRLPPYALAITFDDGYENNFHFAYAALKRMKLSATFFVTTDFVFDRKPLWVDRLEYAYGAGNSSRTEKETRDNELRNALKKLSSEEREERLVAIETETRSLTDFANDRKVYAPLSESEMREMVDGGMTIGAHTQSHPILSMILPDEARSEIALSKLALESAGFTVSPIFAYPNGQSGDWNDKTEELCQKTGFTHALTTEQGVNTRATHPYRLKRIALDGTDDDIATFAAIVAGVRLYLSTIKRLFI